MHSKAAVGHGGPHAYTHPGHLKTVLTFSFLHYLYTISSIACIVVRKGNIEHCLQMTWMGICVSRHNVRSSFFGHNNKNCLASAEICNLVQQMARIASVPALSFVLGSLQIVAKAKVDAAGGGVQQH